MNYFFAAMMVMSDEARVRETLEAWPIAIERRDEAGICGLFDKDLVASFPGTKDRNWDEMCSGLVKALREGKLHYEKPVIEQVIVEGNLAVVRLIWNGEEKGIDVLRRQGDGSWKIIISHAFIRY